MHQEQTVLRRELVIGEFVFVAAIVTCMMLVHPVGVIATDGLSAYGVRVATIVPFGIGLLAVCRACWVTACELIATGRYREAHAYRAIAVLVVIVLVTPYTMHGAVELVHELAGGSLFFIQLLLGAQRQPGTPVLGFGFCSSCNSLATCRLSMRC